MLNAALARRILVVGSRFCTSVPVLKKQWCVDSRSFASVARSRVSITRSPFAFRPSRSFASSTRSTKTTAKLNCCGHQCAEHAVGQVRSFRSIRRRKHTPRFTVVCHILFHFMCRSLRHFLRRTHRYLRITIAQVHATLASMTLGRRSRVNNTDSWKKTHANDAIDSFKLTCPDTACGSQQSSRTSATFKKICRRSCRPRG